MQYISSIPLNIYIRHVAGLVPIAADAEAVWASPTKDRVLRWDPGAQVAPTVLKKSSRACATCSGASGAA
jgi:hypothetical protein